MKVARTLFIAIAAALMAAPSARAQDAPANFLYVVLIDVHPGQAATYEDYVRQIQAAANQIGATPSTVVVFQDMLGSSPNRYRAVIPFNDLSEIDSWQSVPQILVQAHGEDDAAEIIEEGAASIASIENVIRVLQPNATSSAAPALGTRYSSVITTEVDPALAPDYNDFLQRLKVAEDNNGISRDRRVNFMGTSQTYTSVAGFDTFEQASGLPGALTLLQEEYGDQVGQRILERGQAAVRHRTFQVTQFREDLSRIPN